MKERVCRCCGLDPSIKQNKIPLCCDTVQELADFGSGYIAFFSLTKLCFWLCFIFIIFNIDKIKRNSEGNNCYSSKEPNYAYLISLDGSCGKDWITTHAIANYGYGIDYYDKGVMLGFFFVYLVIMTLYYPYLKGLSEKIDKASSVPSDWTIQIKDLSEKVSETDIENMFNNYELMPGVKSVVYKVNSSYKLEEFEAQNNKVQHLKNQAKIEAGKEAKKLRSQFTKQKTALESTQLRTDDDKTPLKSDHEKSGEGYSKSNTIASSKQGEVAIKIDKNSFSKEYLDLIHRMNDESKKVVWHDKLQELISEMTSNREKYFNNIFFVTFKTKRIHDNILERMTHSDNYISRLFHVVTKQRMMLNDGRSVSFRVKEAPEPSDINWSNLSATLWQKVASRSWTYAVSFFLIAIGFGIVLGLKVWQRYLGRQLKTDKTFSVSSLSFRGVSILISFVILVVNSILPMAMRKLTLLEKQTSNTDFFKSLTFKIAFVALYHPGTVHQHQPSRCNHPPYRHVPGNSSVGQGSHLE